MIIGIGTDIIETKDIAQLISSQKSFLQRVFTAREIEYCEQCPHKYQHYAARFAAKEAAMKALGTGWNHGVQWKEIEVQRERPDGPQLTLHGNAYALATQKKIKTNWVSLSHTTQHATAVVIFEK